MNAYLVRPGTKVSLEDHDPRDKGELDGGKDEAKEELARLNTRLEELQELLYAEGRRRVLIVLQAMDAGGKDGTIRRVFDGVNPQGVRVASFKAPTSEELARDFLWRAHRQVPRDGEMVIFNRSHYEDVLVVRVRELAPREVVEQRYAQIADFERMLVESGTTIMKFFLHISREEQRERLQARVDDPAKHWKFNSGDLEERKLWDEYHRAFEIAMERTSTAEAPWWIIPSDRKWYRDLCVSRIVVETLESLGMKTPVAEDVEGVIVE